MVFFIPVVPSIAQDKEVKGLVAYGELAGAAWKYSINVEHELFKTANLTLFGRIGLGVGSVNDSQIKRTYIGAPIGFSLISGMGKHHPELGLHASYVQGRYARVESVGSYGAEGGPGKEIFLVPSVGYRFQQPRGGFFAKFLWTPLIKITDLPGEGQPSIDDQSQSAYTWFGLSAGYFFSRKR